MEKSLKEAYSEVYAILNLMDSKYIEKIPDKVKELIKTERDVSLKINISNDKSLEEQILQKDTITILAILYLNYWCENEGEKKELISLFDAIDKMNEKNMT